ncbi:MAG: motility protein A [Fibrobacter sp.]|nr:motility protein A [Fibrobacter sp.]
MDIATVIGLLLGVYLIVFWGIGDPASIIMFIDIPSIAIVLGGSVAAMLVSYPFSSLIGVFGILKQAFLPQKFAPEGVVKTVVSFAEQARREGILALENRLEELDDEFLKKGIQLAVDGTDPNIIREILVSELNGIEERHGAGAQLFDDIATLAPGFGMIGTLIGLVLMLANMSDPSAIGPAMAVALITTLYGSLVANLFATPIAIKLKNYSGDEMLVKNMMLEGIMSLQSGENPRLVEWKLLAYLSPDLRLKAAEKEE